MQSVRYAMVLLVPMVTLAMDSSEGSSGDFKGSNQSTYDDFFGAESGWAKSWEVAGSNVWWGSSILLLPIPLGYLFKGGGEKPPADLVLKF